MTIEHGAALTQEEETQRRAEKLLAAAYPEMLQSVVDMLRRERYGEQRFVLHIGENDETRLKVESGYFVKLS